MASPSRIAPASGRPSPLSSTSALNATRPDSPSAGGGNPPADRITPAPPGSGCPGRATVAGSTPAPPMNTPCPLWGTPEASASSATNDTCPALLISARPAGPNRPGPSGTGRPSRTTCRTPEAVGKEHAVVVPAGPNCAGQVGPEDRLPEVVERQLAESVPEAAVDPAAGVGGRVAGADQRRQGGRPVVAEQARGVERAGDDGLDEHLAAFVELRGEEVEERPAAAGHRLPLPGDGDDPARVGEEHAEAVLVGDAGQHQGLPGVVERRPDELGKWPAAGCRLPGQRQRPRLVEAVADEHARAPAGAAQRGEERGGRAVVDRRHAEVGERPAARARRVPAGLGDDDDVPRHARRDLAPRRQGGPARGRRRPADKWVGCIIFSRLNPPTPAHPTRPGVAPHRRRASPTTPPSRGSHPAAPPETHRVAPPPAQQQPAGGQKRPAPPARGRSRPRRRRRRGRRP